MVVYKVTMVVKWGLVVVSCFMLCYDGVTITLSLCGLRKWGEGGLGNPSQSQEMVVGWETGEQLLARAMVTRFPSILGF